MNLYLIANSITWLCAFIGFIYGAFVFFKPKKAVYAQMITLFAGCMSFGICFVRKKKKLFFCGTFALLALASTYHAIFNMLVQSEYNYLGYILPAVTYVPILLLRRKGIRLIEI